MRTASGASSGCDADCIRRLDRPDADCITGPTASSLSGRVGPNRPVLLESLHGRLEGRNHLLVARLGLVQVHEDGPAGDLDLGPKFPEPIAFRVAGLSHVG